MLSKWSFIVKNIIANIVLLICMIPVYAGENLLKNPEFSRLENGSQADWTFVSSGCGKFKTIKGEDGVTAIEVTVDRTGDPKGNPSLMNGGWQKERMLVVKSETPLKASVMARSMTGGSAFLAVTFRTADNKWLSVSESPKVKLNEQWQKLEVMTLPSSNTAYVQFNAFAIEGAVQFKSPSINACELAVPASRTDNPAEFWLNVDYFDELDYCRNAGAVTYEEKEIVKFFQQCVQYNVTGVHWRVSGLGTFAYPTQVGTVYPGRIAESKLTPKQKQNADVFKRIDPLKIAVREARKNNIKIYIWVTIMDEYGTVKEQEELFTNPLLLDHPEYMMLDKNGKPQKGTLCYNIPAVRKYRLDIIRELVNYHADGIYLCTRTHAFYHGADKDDQYGYNQIIVEEYKKRLGIDIMKQDFDKTKWQDIKAEGLDKLFEDAAKIIHDAGQKVRLSVKTVQNENYGWPFGNAKMYWKSWVKKGWIDSLVVGHYYIPYSRIIDDTKSFREFSSQDQKIYFWMQLWHYQKRCQTPLDDLIREIQITSFAGADGLLCHEAIGLEERPDTYWQPLAEAIKKYWGVKK